MIKNYEQEAAEIEKLKPKMMKHIQQQREREKGKKWIKIDCRTGILEK